MSMNKRQLVDLAFESIGLASFVFDISPEEQQSAIRRLDSMMALWDSKGIRLGYNLTVDPKNADPDQDSGVPDIAYEAVFLNLAIRLGAAFGKQVPRTVSGPAKDAYDTLLTIAATPPPQMQANRLPAGAGNRWRTFTRGPVDSLTTGDSFLEL